MTTVPDDQADGESDSDDAFDRALTDISDAFEAGGIERAAELIDALGREYGDDHPEVRFQRAALAWEREGPESAIPLLDALIVDAPDYADAHYARAIACEELEDFEGMSRHFLEVLRLDARIDDELGLGSEADLDFIEHAAQDAIETVPEEFRELLRGVPIVLEPRPHRDLVAEGFDPRSLGLFEGLEHSRQASGDHTAPTRIVLFHANLLADFPDREMLAEEIEITVLHEIGHYFGLDEDDVERLGLA